MKSRVGLIVGMIAVLSVTAWCAVPATNPALEKAFTMHGEPLPVWVILPAPDSNPALDAHYFSLLPKASRFRRILNGAGPSPIDRPVDPIYLQRIQATGVAIRQVSRFVHAVSVNASRKQLAQLAKLNFVTAIEPVAASKPTSGAQLKTKPSTIHYSPSTVTSTDELDSLDYGESRNQLDQINVLPLHQQGYSGRGVIGGILDTGFRWYHSCLDSMTLLAQYDFVFHDNQTANQVSDTVIAWDHGTATLSCIVGASDGNMFGAAYNATMILCKTEDVRSEMPIEEDNYVAGLELCDSLGARGVSSSLGYIDWYTWADMNGHTSVCTQGVLVAARRGMLVITAAGNENGSSWNHLVAPGDADSCLTVGAVDSTGAIAYFSSRGPTYDGRMKPDVCARGWATYCASSASNTDYWRLYGTSLATPLVSGACFLLWEKHPYWTAMMMRRAMRETASQHATPDTIRGWGIINTAAADTYSFGGNRTPTGSLSSISACCGGAIQVVTNYTDPDGDSLLYDFWYRFPSGPLFHYGFPDYVDTTDQTITIPLEFDSLGREPIELYCNVTDRIHVVRDSTIIDYTSVQDPNSALLPKVFSLSAAPNPFNATTILTYALPKSSAIELIVYSADGREISRSNLGAMNAGTHRFELSSTQIGTATGIRFVRLQAGNSVKVLKVVYLK